jgi:hypothetical protein
MVVGKGFPDSELQSSDRKARKKLLGAANAAKGSHRSGFTAARDWNFHFAKQTPDGPLPTPGPQFSLQIRIVGWNCNHIGPVNGLNGLAEIAGGQQAVLPIPAVEQQNIHGAVELAMLEAIVEQMDEGAKFFSQECNRRRIRFGEQACVESTGGNIDRNAASCDEKRFVPEFLRGSREGYSCGELAAAAIAAGEHVDLEAAPRERIGQRDGQRRFARAAGGEVANAYYGIAQTPDWLRPCAQAQFAQPVRQHVGRNQGE